MIEPIVSCPKCRTEIKLTESLAAPLLEATRKKFEAELARKDEAVERREKDLASREKALARAQSNLELQLEQKLAEERPKMAAAAEKRAKLASSFEINAKAKQVADLEQIVAEREKKLAEAQKAQTEALKKQRELDEAKRTLELTVEKRVQESMGQLRERAEKEAHEKFSLKVLEKEQTIQSMQKQIEDLRRKAEQGSQQMQGEALELQLEALLRTRFPQDEITPVPKGEHGGDVLHRVVIPNGAGCGTILWEFKRTKNWSDSWLTKLRDDQRTAKAEIAVIVSAVLPKGSDTFDFIEDVWIVHPRAIVPVALALRQRLVEVSCARQASEGQQPKMAMMYEYLTGPKFRLRVQAIVESFTSMADDLQREKRAITKQWAKREEQIQRVLLATAGMYGELQAIAGRSLQELEGLDLKAIEARASTGELYPAAEEKLSF